MTKEKLEEASYWHGIIQQMETRLKECEAFTIEDYTGKNQKPRVHSYYGTMEIPFDLVEPIRNMLIGFYKQEIEAAKNLFEEM